MLAGNRKKPVSELKIIYRTITTKTPTHYEVVDKSKYNIMNTTIAHTADPLARIIE